MSDLKKLLELSQQRFRIGQFLVDPNDGTIRRGVETDSLTRKSLEVLIVLLREAPRIVSRDDLLSEVWPDVIVTDAVLTNCVWELRSKLDGELAESSLIQTHRGRGYRYAGPEPVATSDGRPRARRYRRFKPWLAAAAAIAAFISVLTVAASFGPRRPSTETAEADRAREAFARAEGIIRGAPGSPASLAWLRSLAERYPSFAPGLVRASEHNLRRSVRTPKTLVDAGEMADRAIEVAPEWDAPRLARITVEWVSNGDVARIEEGLREIIRIDPTSVKAHIRLAWVQASRGAIVEGRETALRAIELSRSEGVPDRTLANAIHALYFNRGFDEVVEQVETLSPVRPRAGRGRVDLRLYSALSHLALGDLDAATALAVRIARPSAARIDDYAYLLGATGRSADAAALLDDAELVRRINPYAVAKLYLAAGDRARALQYLSDAVDGDVRSRLFVTADPALDGLRGDDGFPIPADRRTAERLEPSSR